MPPILQPEHEAIRSQFAAFIPAFAERAPEHDRSGTFPSKNFGDLRDAGLLGLLIPTQLGGLGKSYLDFEVAIEETARGCPSTGLCLGMHYAAAFLSRLARAEQQQLFADGIVNHGEIWTVAFSEPGSGSHFLSPQCKARKVDGGYILDGVKCFVTSASAADYFVMNAVIDGCPPGEFTLFAISAKNVKGLKLGPAWDSMGMRANDSREVRFTQCFVSEEYRLAEEHHGLEAMRSRPHYVQLGLAADSIGVARASLDLAVNHVKSRVFPSDGAALSAYQSIRFMLADIALAVESATYMVRQAAWVAENSPTEATLAMARAKCVANEAAVLVANQALQIIGGRGYLKDHPIERLVRDARAGSLMAFTTEQTRDMIGTALIGMNPSSR